MSEETVLREEIIESEKARADLQKWKLVIVAALGAGALGIGSNNPNSESYRYLLCGIPPLCGYADLLCGHLTLRIMVIGMYLRKASQATPTGPVLTYEEFVEQARSEAQAFHLEEWVMAGSTLGLSVAIAAYGALHPLVHPDKAFLIWPFVLSGLVGVFVWILLVVTLSHKVAQIKHLSICRPGTGMDDKAEAKRSGV